MDASFPDIRRVDAKTLREIFNVHCWPRIQRGEIREHVLSRTPVTRPFLKPNGEGFRVRADYYDNGQRVAFCVYFLHADGTIAASGLPDPKLVYHDGVIYKQ